MVRFNIHTHTHTQSRYHYPLLFSPQSYYRLGVSYQGLERHEEAMVAFAEGLVTDPKQASMLHGMTESMLKSRYKGVCNV